MWVYELETVNIAYSLPTINVIIFICEIKLYFVTLESVSISPHYHTVHAKNFK